MRSPFDRLDRYVARAMLGSWVICLCFLVGIFVLLDLLQNFDKFQDGLAKLPPGHDQLGLLNIPLYYLSFLPFVFLQVAPFVTVLAAMFAVSRLMGASELTPMLFTGRSILRVLRPIFVWALLVAVGMGVVREWVTPKLLLVKDDLQAVLKGQTDRSYGNLVMMLDERLTAFVDVFNVYEDRIEGLKVYDKRELERPSLITRAAVAKYLEDGAKGSGWYLEGGSRQRYGETEVEELAFTRIKGFEPEDIRKQLKERRELLDLSYSDCLERLERQPELAELSFAFHHFFTFPLANIVLLLLALPFALRFERGSRAERMVSALAICGAYLVSDLVSQNLGARGTLHPVVAGWLPTVLFGSLGLVLFDAVQS
ncbi:MAG: hypothetical protein CSA62_04430 [Planctomycetota bacterium]|nr:MAG: hypothetical protein CSA62_04430 [Planctomycetota bacterium]